MCQLFFLEESIYEISNLLHAQFKTYAMHQKVSNVKMPKITKGHNSRSTFQKFIQKLIRSSTHQYQSVQDFKALASIAFEIFCWQDFIHIFSKSHNSKKGHNPDGKKKYVSAIFSWTNHIWNFKTLACMVQKLCYASKSVTDGRSDTRMHTPTKVPEAICPSNFFEVGGIIRALYRRIPVCVVFIFMMAT